MDTHEITLHYCVIPYYKDENLFRWSLGYLVSLIEETPFNHVWLSIKCNDNEAICVDLSGYENTPKEYNKLKEYYSILNELKIELSKEEYEISILKINELKNVKYSFLKLIMLLINRKFKTKLLYNEYNSTSTEIIARILKATNENYYINDPQLCGLKELKALL